jgi:two-component system phosphate regulon response regulator PhoB
MAHEAVLVIEDEEDIAELVRYNLQKQGYRVSLAASGEEAMERIAAAPPDLIILDLMLPGIDGLEVCRRLKRNLATEGIPIVMLTAKGGETDVVTGLEMGADDYIPKPFSPRVLVARVRAVLRRKTGGPEGDREQSEVIRLHEVVIHPGRHEVLVGGAAVCLTATEFRVLQILAERPGWVFTRNQIASQVHGDEYVVTDRSVDVQIVGLRKKLGPAGRYIETVRGVGYRFRE